MQIIYLKSRTGISRLSFLSFFFSTQQILITYGADGKYTKILANQLSPALDVLLFCLTSLQQAFIRAPTYFTLVFSLVDSLGDGFVRAKHVLGRIILKTPPTETMLLCRLLSDLIRQKNRSFETLKRGLIWNSNISNTDALKNFLALIYHGDKYLR